MRTPTLLTIGLCTLAAFFGWETYSARHSPPPSVDNAGRASMDAWRPGAPAPDPPPPPDPSGVVAAVAVRPLFRPDRQPYREQDMNAMSRNYDAELSRLSLIGVLTFGDDLKGLVVGKGSPRPERWEVKEGDSLPGFTVKEVRIDGLSVVADGREFLLPLYAGGPTGAAGSIRTEGSRVTPSPASRTSAPPPPQQAEARTVGVSNPQPAGAQSMVQTRRRNMRPTYIPGNR
jgi:hypothetical protein